jgi:hypothetical protein
VKSITLIFLLISISSFTQTYSEIIPDKDVIDFMTWRLNKDTRKTKQYVSEKIMIITRNNFVLDSTATDSRSNPYFLFKKENHLDSIFSADDISFFTRQVEKTRNKVWKLEAKNLQLETPVSFHPDHTTWSYSIPYYSVDRQKVIIVEAFYCGIVCGGGAYYIYGNRSANGWILLKKVNEWAE